MRIKIKKRKQAIGYHGGLAYTELGLAYLLNNRFQEAISAYQAGKALLVQLPLFKEGNYWPDLAVIHKDLSLIGFAILREAIKFRRRKLGPCNTL